MPGETQATTPTGAQPGQAAAGADKEQVPVLPGPGGQKVVPLEALEKVRNEKQSVAAELERAKEQNRLAEERLALHRAALSNAAGAAPAPPPEKGPLADMADDEVITAADMKKLMGGLEQKLTTVVSRAQVEAMPDYHALTNEHLRNVLNSLPEPARAGMVQQIRQAPNPRLLAYNLGMLDPAYQAKVKGGQGAKLSPEQQAAADAVRIAQNAAKPGSVSAAVTSTGLGAGDYYLSLTDEQFDAEVQRVLRSG